mmetsp:Transcript_10210/g.27460  ORF Transcript_10210/g.27460 Transcript_10210/m.27460 type:complete len:376 (-) Transcript_10210:1246-2373(-)
MYKDELPNSVCTDIGFWAPSTELVGPITTKRGVQATAVLTIHEPVTVVTALRNNPPITIAPDLRLRAASTDALVPVRAARGVECAVRGLVDDPVLAPCDELEPPHALVAVHRRGLCSCAEAPSPIPPNLCIQRSLRGCIDELHALAVEHVVVAVVLRCRRGRQRGRCRCGRCWRRGTRLDLDAPNTVVAHPTCRAASAPIASAGRVQASVVQCVHDPVKVASALGNEVPLAVGADFRRRISRAHPLAPVGAARRVQHPVGVPADDPVTTSSDADEPPKAVLGVLLRAPHPEALAPVRSAAREENLAGDPRDELDHQRVVTVVIVLTGRGALGWRWYWYVGQGTATRHVLARVKVRLAQGADTLACAAREKMVLAR